MPSPMFDFQVALYEFAKSLIDLDAAKNAIAFNASTLCGKIFPLLAPTVTGISPSSGPVAGGTTVTITGTQLELTTEVRLLHPSGQIFFTDVTVIDDNTVTAVTPAAGTGSAPIYLSTTYSGTNGGVFSYV